MSQNVKSIFGYRKNKAGQLCGAVLAAGLLSVSLSAGQQAFADEVQTADSEVSTVAENQEIQTATRADVEAANTQLETAVTNAQNVGVETTEEPTVSHSTAEAAVADTTAQIKEVEEVTAQANSQAEQIAAVEVENKEIQEKYNAAMTTYNEEKAEYDKAVAAREEALKNPTYRTSDNAFPKSDVDEFLKGTDISKVSYVSTLDENISSLDTSKLTPLSQEELQNFYQGLIDNGSVSKDDGTYKYYLSQKGHYYKVSVGDTFTFSKVFRDAETGQWVSLKYKIKEINGVDENPKDTGYLMIHNGLNLTAIGDTDNIGYSVEFVNDKGESVTLSNVILGYGDIDGTQRLSISSSGLSDNYLAGSNITVSRDGDTLTASSTAFNSDSSLDITNQVWFLLKNVSGYDYNFKLGKAYGKEGYKTTIGWHQVGAIPFSIEIPEVPEAPVKPELNLKEVPKAEKLSVSYHKTYLIRTSWVKDENGEPLKPSEDGDQPQDSFDGRTFKIKVVKDNGDIEYRYVKVETPEEPTKTETPTPTPTSNTPQPQVQAPVVAKQAVLPQTGDNTTGSVFAIVGGAILSALGFIGIRRKKEN